MVVMTGDDTHNDNDDNDDNEAEDAADDNKSKKDEKRRGERRSLPTGNVGMDLQTKQRID